MAGRFSQLVELLRLFHGFERQYPRQLNPRQWRDNRSVSGGHHQSVIVETLLFIAVEMTRGHRALFAIDGGCVNPCQGVKAFDIAKECFITQYPDGGFSHFIQIIVKPFNVIGQRTGSIGNIFSTINDCYFSICIKAA